MYCMKRPNKSQSFIIYEKGRRGKSPSASSLHPKHHLCSFLGNPGGRQQALKQRPALRIDFSFLNFVLLFLLLMMMIVMMMLLLLVIWTSHQTLQTRLHLRKTEKGDPFPEVPYYPCVASLPTCGLCLR